VKIGFVSPEMAPFAKSGELADVVSSLPKYLCNLGLKVSVFMPMYRTPEIENAPKDLIESDHVVPIGEKKVKARVYRMKLGKCTAFFIDNPSYFWRESIYGTGKGNYLDNDERFIFFNRAVMEFILRKRMPLDILHCHNWPASLVPVFLKTHYANHPHFRNTASVLTLHNVAYQGESPPDTLVLTGLNWKYFNQEQLSLNGKFNFLKAGVMFSDALNTVSPSYKRDIMAENSSYGLGKILKGRKDVFFSIRNGVDNEIWDPETDPNIAAKYSPSDFKNKEKCKLDLIREFQLSIGVNTPLLGMFSHFSPHKGFDILLDSMDKILELNVGLVVAGRGDDVYHDRMKKFQKKHPGRFSVRAEMEQALMHKIAAGADLYLMPSLSEPCGLNQLYCFRYGTVPVVRKTGGLSETVIPYDKNTGKGNGFEFIEYSSKAFLLALKKALECYKDKKTWNQIMRSGFQENFSWDKAAKKYKKLYEKAIKIKRGDKLDRKHTISI